MLLLYSVEVLEHGGQNIRHIDPMQKWLPLNYSFVRIQNSLTNLVWNNKFFTIFVSKNEVSEGNLNTNKRII